MTRTLRLIAILFCAVGALLLRASLADPNADVPKPVRTAPVAVVEFGAAQKLGRFMTVTLEGDPERFQASRLERVSGLEERLRARVEAGTTVSISAVVRDAKNWATPEGVPLPILALRRGDELLLSAETFTTSLERLARVAAPVAGSAGVLIGLTLFVVTLRRPRRSPLRA